jgi:hypothetical protein
LGRRGGWNGWVLKECFNILINTQRKQLFRPKQMLSKNVYQELFLRYAECSLDEEILTFKKKFEGEFLF